MDGTDDPGLAQEGRNDQAKGRQAVGHAKHAAENLKEGIKGRQEIAVSRRPMRLRDATCAGL
jgi:uncharacterized protein YjbJ (UPF0337 family)